MNSNNSKNSNWSSESSRAPLHYYYSTSLDGVVAVGEGNRRADDE
jgi:hypothetical protein